MKRIISATLILMYLFAGSACQNQDKRERKEAAKDYMKRQTIHYNETEKAGDTSEKIVIDLTETNFDKTIAEGITLVDFWAGWCRPCKIQMPIVNEIAEEYKDKIKVAKVDVDKNRMVSEKAGIQNLPTLIIYRDGKVLERLVGLHDKATLSAYIDKHLQ